MKFEPNVIMILDKDTGEISKTSKNRTGVSVNFIMLFWEVGEEALGQEPSAVAIRVFLSILHRMEYNKNQIYFGPDLRQEIMKIQGINKSQLSRALAILRERDLMLVTEDNRSIINPLLAWKGNLSERERFLNNPDILIPIKSKEF